MGIRKFIRRKLLGIIAGKIEKEPFMQAIKDWISGYKTYILMVTAIIGAIVAWSSGDLTLIQMIEAIIAALGGITLRAGIKKVEKAKG